MSGPGLLAGRHGWEGNVEVPVNVLCIGPSKNGEDSVERWCPPPIQAIVRMVDRQPRTVLITPCTYGQTSPTIHPGAWDTSAWDGDPMASCCRYMKAPYRAAKQAKY